MRVQQYQQDGSAALHCSAVQRSAALLCNPAHFQDTATRPTKAVSLLALAGRCVGGLCIATRSLCCCWGGQGCCLGAVAVLLAAAWPVKLVAGFEFNMPIVYRKELLSSPLSCLVGSRSGHEPWQLATVRALCATLFLVKTITIRHPSLFQDVAPQLRETCAFLRSPITRRALCSPAVWCGPVVC